MFSRRRAGYGSVRNLTHASGLSKNIVQKFLQTKISYTKFGSKIRCFENFQLASKTKTKFDVWTWPL